MIVADLRIAARSLRRSPGLLAAAVASLALAIGAGVAGFGVLDAVRFRALPFPSADRLMLISEVPTGGCGAACDVNYKTFDLLRAHRFKSVDALSAFAFGPKGLGTGADQIDLTAGIVSGTVFSILGASPEIGRTFAPDEDRLGAAATMVIGHDLWVNAFGADPSVIGKTYVLSEEPFTLIGVMPPGFAFEGRAQTWLAATRYLDPRTGTSLRAINVLARLAPGATPEQLVGELRTLEAAANVGRPERARTTFAVAPLRSRYVSAMQSHDLVFAAIVAAILAIGCANVASLVLVRAVRRQRELAVRSALGASRYALVRHVFLENAVLCAGGLLIGLALAAIALHALDAVAPLRIGARVAGMEYRLDLRAAAFATSLALLIAGVLSVAPVRLLFRTDLQTTLREGSLSATRSRGAIRTQQLFVVIQTACAVALLVATGLMTRTVARFAAIDLGYDAMHAISVTAVPSHSGRTPQRYLPAADRLLVELAAIPRVEAVAVRMPVPFAAPRPRVAGAIVVPSELAEAAMTLGDGRAVDPATLPRSAFGVSADYFKVLDIPLVAGRAFAATDDAHAPAVAIVNQWAARHWWPNESPIGQTFTVDTAPGVRAVITVVGVARDNLSGQGSILLAKSGPEVYRPFKQANFWIANYYLRTHTALGPIVEEAQRVVMRAIPTNGRVRGGPLSVQVDAQLEAVRTNGVQIGGFAVVGLLLAITGLYGVLSYSVQQRTQEIGIRGVLGAGRGRILGMVMSQAVRVTLVGIGVGLIVAALSMRLIRDLLYGTRTDDPVVYATVSLIALLVALLASYLPARRAARIDPVIAIRGL